MHGRGINHGGSCFRWAEVYILVQSRKKIFNKKFIVKNILSRADIIETRAGSVTGFLAEDEIEYAKVLASIIQMHSKEQHAIRVAARY